MKFALCLFLCCGASAVAQLPDVSPVKPGLWQSEGTTKITITGSPAETQTEKIQICLGKDTWKDFMGVGGESKKNCEQRNQTYSNRTYAFDMVCGGSDAAGSMKGHIVVVFDTDEAAHATGEIDANAGPGQNMHITSAIKTHFVAASCGELKPGEQKDIK